MKLLITGGAGFIGSHLVHHFVNKYPHYEIVNLDALTYAGNPANLEDLTEKPNYHFVYGDLTNAPFIGKLLHQERIDAIIHLAAESHVDRSISDPLAFARTNIMGTLNLLEAARREWGEAMAQHRFYQVSTDEVYGSLTTTEQPFTEHTPYAPRSPYSASKAAADHFVRSYHETYGLNVVLSSCSNNFGPNQFPEKLIPLFIQNIVNNKPLPVYGRGENIRDWLYVSDHCEAIDLIFHQGRNGETYNIGGNNEWTNIALIKKLICIVDSELGRPEGASLSLIEYVPDRLGHDLRYAINSSKLQQELHWRPSHSFDENLLTTVRWYLSNKKWLDDIASGAYRQCSIRQ